MLNVAECCRMLSNDQIKMRNSSRYSRQIGRPKSKSNEICKANKFKNKIKEIKSMRRSQTSRNLKKASNKGWIKPK